LKKLQEGVELRLKAVLTEQTLRLQQVLSPTDVYRKITIRRSRIVCQNDEGSEVIEWPAQVMINKYT
jgi:hypothetical protein